MCVCVCVCVCVCACVRACVCVCVCAHVRGPSTMLAEPSRHQSGTNLPKVKESTGTSVDGTEPV